VFVCMIGALGLAASAAAQKAPLSAAYGWAPAVLSKAELPRDEPPSDAALVALFNAAAPAGDASGFAPATSLDAGAALLIRLDLPGALAAALPAPRDLSRFSLAAALYRKGDISGGDAAGQAVDDPLQRTALAWVALRSAPRPDYARLAAFGAAHADWPSQSWIRYEQEAALYAARPAARIVAGLFAADGPHTAPGKLALARAALELGRTDQSAALARFVWREDDLDAGSESALLREFAPLLTKADHKYRADRLFYAQRFAASLRAATQAGPEAVALANLRLAALNAPQPQAAADALPAFAKRDPGVLFARIKALAHANRVVEAAALMAKAPGDAERIDGDRWWRERRALARQLLDGGLNRDAYLLCASAAPASDAARIEAAFHAGWIALRFLHDADLASTHFAEAAQLAHAPLSIARAAYWRGRAAEEAGQSDEARRHYEHAAGYSIAYYGQLAAQRLQRPLAPLRAPARVATGQARDEATRVIELLYEAQLDAVALPLALDAARHSHDEAQLAALAQVLTRRGDALASVEFGKAATERGFALDETAFPTFGVPGFAPLAKSADLASIYAVARQESEFVARAASGAGAKGVMQLLPSTARETARRSGVPFDAGRLTLDPVFNIQLGAAFLGQLLADEGGSQVLAFAAYNAGGGRVQQWITAYGDPRSGRVDPVDWVERIPFEETRDYVQRVSENLGVYRAQLGGAPAATTARDGRVARAGAWE